MIIIEKKINKKLLVTVLTLGGFFTTINQSILNVSLSYFKDMFDVSSTAVQWLTTGFMLVSGVLIPLMAYLMKRFTTRQLFMVAMFSLLIGGLISGIAGNFYLLLFGRLITSIGAAILMPLTMSIVTIIYPKEKRGTIMGIVGLAIIFGAALAPTLSGFILYDFSWRWLFLGLTPFVLLTIWLGYRSLVNVSETEKAKLDIKSVIYSTIGLIALLYSFSAAGGRGWYNPFVITLLTISIVFIVLFCSRQLKMKDPLLNLSIFKIKAYRMVTGIMFLVTMITYADMIILPLYLAEGRDFTPLDAGLLLFPGAIANAVLSPFTGKLLDKFGAKIVFTIGLVIMIPCLWAATDLSASTTITFLAVRTLFLRIGISFLMMPLMTESLNTLPKHLVDHGSAMTNTLRQVSAAIGTALIIAIYTSHTNVYTKKLLDLDDSLSNTNAGIRALIHSADDTYYYMTLMAVLALLLTLFLPKNKKTTEENKEEKE
ncbi:putative MFS-type transporter YhcA [Kurthia sibirica]|nr:putative MFS-type transporter YhcA [Kurthia sibirica]